MEILPPTESQPAGHADDGTTILDGMGYKATGRQTCHCGEISGVCCKSYSSSATQNLSGCSEISSLLCKGLTQVCNANPRAAMKCQGCFASHTKLGLQCNPGTAVQTETAEPFQGYPCKSYKPEPIGANLPYGNGREMAEL